MAGTRTARGGLGTGRPMEGRMCGKDRQVAVDLASNFQKIWKMKKKSKKRERGGGRKEEGSKGAAGYLRESFRGFFFFFLRVWVVSEGLDLTC
jgi:hypothetical protein